MFRSSILFFLLCSTSIGFAQAKRKPVVLSNNSFGVFFSTNISKVKIKETNWRATTVTDSLTNIAVQNKAMFSLGFVRNRKISESVLFRMGFLLSFNESAWNYQYKTKETIVKVPKITTDLPLHMLLRKQYKKLFPLLLTGVTPKLNIAQKGKAVVIRENAVDCTFDYGIGCQYNTGKFYVNLELVAQNGLVNTKKVDAEFKNSLITSVRNNAYTFNLVFSGLFKGDATKK